jgi:hypothetical protein
VSAPPPADRSARTLAVVTHRGFNLCLLVSAALLLGVLALGVVASWLDWVELVLGLALAGEGLLLATNWRDARRLLVARLRARRAQASFTARVGWRLASPVLQLLGVVWIGAGVLTAALALRRIV